MNTYILLALLALPPDALLQLLHPVHNLLVLLQENKLYELKLRLKSL